MPILEEYILLKIGSKVSRPRIRTREGKPWQLYCLQEFLRMIETKMAPGVD
jgi:hypothetical protein